MKTNSLIAIASILTLSAGLTACGDKAAQPADDKAAAKGEVAGEASNLAFDAGGMPIFKAGLWESRIVEGGGGDDGLTRSCVNAELDAKTREQLFGESEGCTKNIERARGGLRISGVCEQGPVKISTVMTMVGNQTKHTLDLEMTVDNTADPEPATTTKMVIQAKHLGPCPAGMQPGDEIDSDQMDNGE